MDDQHSDSRATLDQLFWTGVESSRQRCGQPAAKDAPDETAVLPAPQATLSPPETVGAPDADKVEPAETAVQHAPPIECSAAEPEEPKAGSREPEPAQEIPSVDSPAVQPTLIEAADAAHPFPAEPQAAPTEASLYEKKRGEIDELMGTLRGSLDNVEQHGRRAEAILTNMLLRLRESSAAHQPVSINPLGGERLRACG